MPWKKGNRLPVVAESEADEPTRQVFQEVRQTLGEPALKVFYSALGTYPQFLQMHWKQIGPLARSRELLALADRLRAEAYTRAHNYFPVPGLSLPPAPQHTTRAGDLGRSELNLADAACQELAARVDLYQHRDAVLLLLFSTQMQALDGPVGNGGQLTPAEPPDFAREETPAVAERNADLRGIFREIRRALALPYLNSEYEALACRPEFLIAYWRVLKGVLQSPLYRECQYGMREGAWALVRELPGTVEMSLDNLIEAGMAQDDIASVGRILELFVKNLSGLALNLAIARILLEGGNQGMGQAVEGTECEPGRAA